jgi:hypothetical protein
MANGKSAEFKHYLQKLTEVKRFAFVEPYLNANSLIVEDIFQQLS